MSRAPLVDHPSVILVVLIYVYIFCMCGCPFKVRSIHIFGAMNGLVAMGMGGWGDGLHAESDWGVWRAPLEVVSADIHSLAPRASVAIHLVRRLSTH